MPALLLVAVLASLALASVAEAAPTCTGGTTTSIRLGKTAQFGFGCSAGVTSATVTAQSNGTATVTGPLTAPVVNFTPAAAGSASFTLTVTDGAGSTPVSRAFNVVANSAPVCRDRGTLHTKLATDIGFGDTFTAPCSDINAQDASLTYDVPAGAVSPAGAGTATVGGSPAYVTFHPAAGFTGTALVTFTASDGTATTTHVQRVHVSDGALCDPAAPQPIARNGKSTEFEVDCTAPNGASVSIVIDDPVDQGTLTSSIVGEYEYKANFGAAGEDAFLFHATSAGVAASPPVTQKITVGPAANHAPFCRDEEETLDAGKTFFLANCFDDDDDELVVRPVSPPGAGATVTQARDNTLRFAASTPGTYTFTFKARDSLGAESAPATAVMTVVDPVLPTCSASPVSTAAVVPGGSRSITVTCTRADDYLLASSPTQGEVRRLGTSAPGAGSFVYTANDDATTGTPDSFTVRAYNTKGEATQLVTVSVPINAAANAPPTCTSLPGTSNRFKVATSSSVPIDLGRFCSDPEEGALVFTEIAATGGTVTGPGDEPDTYAYTADATAGNAALTFRAQDPQGNLSTPATFNLVKGTAASASPTCAAPTARTLKPGSSAGFSLSCTDPNSSWQDPQVISIVDGPDHGVLVPPGPSRGSSSSRTYFADVDVAGAATDSFTFRSDTASGRSAPQAASITFGNRAPSCVSLSSANAPILVKVGQTASARPFCSDDDGDPIAYSVVSGPAHGTIDPATLVYTPTAGYTGTDTAQIRGSDGALDSTATVYLKVYAPLAPECRTVAPPPQVRPGATLRIPIDCEDQTGGFDYGFAITTPPGGGSTATAANFELTIVAGSTPGAASVAYTVSTANGTTAPITQAFEVTAAANAAPGCSGTYDGVTRAGVALAIAPGAVGCTDADGDALSLSTFSDPQHGTLAAGSGGGLVYAPAAGFVGTDSFLAFADDGHGGSSILQASIVVTADPAVLTCVRAPAPTVRPGGTATIAVDCSHTTRSAVASVVPADPPSGSATAASNLASLTYTADAGAATGIDSFAVTVTTADGTADTYTQKVKIDAAANRLPTCTFASARVRPGQSVAIAPSCTDPDGDTLTLVKVSDPEAGTGTVTGGGAEPFTFTAPGGYDGPAAFTFKATDGHGGASEVTGAGVTVGQVNAPPVCQSLNPSTPAGVAKEIAPNCTDADGDAITPIAVTQPAHGTVTVANDKLVYTPAPGYQGSDPFTYKGKDARSASSVQSVSMTVTAALNAPSCAAGSDSTRHGVAKVLTLSCTPFAGGALTYSVQTPSQGTLTGLTGNQVTYTPPSAGFTGAVTFSYRATEGGVDSALATFTVTVTNATPSCDAPAAQTATTGVAKDVAVTCADTDGDALTLTGSALHGTVTGIGATGVRYTPDAAYTGPDTVTFAASDGLATSTARTFAVTVSGTPAETTPTPTPTSSATATASPTTVPTTAPTVAPTPSPACAAASAALVAAKAKRARADKAVAKAKKAAKKAKGKKKKAKANKALKKAKKAAKKAAAAAKTAQVAADAAC